MDKQKIEYYKGIFLVGTLIEHYRVYVDENTFDYLNSQGEWIAGISSWEERQNETKIVKSDKAGTHGLFYWI